MAADLPRVLVTHIVPDDHLAPLPGKVTLMAGGQPVLEGSFGIIRERNAVRITGKVNPDNDTD